MAILAMVIDTLSGRTPLYRLTEFFEEKDTELLLGSAIEPERFCDTNLGRSMDKIFEVGTLKIFSQLAQNALTEFDVDPRRLNFDTTSVSVYGDYASMGIMIWPIHRFKSPMVIAKIKGRILNNS